MKPNRTITNTSTSFNLTRITTKLLVAVALVVALASCSDDDDDPAPGAPVISNFEFGEGGTHNTDGKAYKRSDIHLEAEILAEVAVRSITVNIHGHDVTPGEGEVEWDLEQEFTDADYQVKNPTFHEHIDIPANIPAGEYHITLTVTDENGKSAEVEGHLEIVDAITVSDVSIEQSVTRGDHFDMQFMVSSLHGIQHIVVDIHADGITPGEGEAEWHFAEEFEEGYHGETQVEFHEHIDVPATAPDGEYHIVITIEDEKGIEMKFETHVDVTE
ncbi:MAG TPA: DUF4625 domain-containing protein [Ohtaekwangia sp.]|nr:DUF4625 domain-containing protein [Ohtaekwangia sp.]